jgi:hypothetical protein
VTVTQTLTNVRIDQPGAAVKNGGGLSFTAAGHDQFGNSLGA